MNTSNFIIIEKFIKQIEYNYSPHTVKEYQRILEFFFKSLKLDIEKITKNDINSWLIVLKDKGLHNNTRKNYLASIRTFFDYCCEKKYIVNNPTLKVSKIKRKKSYEREPLTKEEVMELQQIANDNFRDAAAVATLYYTGVRIGELVNIKISDINFSNLTVHIRKTKDLEERIIFFTPYCAEKLKAYLATRNSSNEYIFINRFGEKFSDNPGCGKLRAMFDNLNKKKTFKKHVTAHLFRHTLATHLHEKGVNIKLIAYILGHDNLENTSLYIHNSKQNLRKHYDKTFN